MTNPTDAQSFARNYVRGFQQCLDALPMESIAAVADRIAEAYQQGRLVAILGNGGSAATASHIACDLGKTILGTEYGQKRLRVLALTDNMPLVTAWGNDVHYDAVFAEQLRAWVQPGDVVIAISGSGNSPNVYEGVLAARELGAYTIGFLGFNGGKVGHIVDLPVLVASDHYGYIEDAHMMFGHLVTAYLKERLAIHASNGPSQSAGAGGGGGHALAAPDPDPAQANGAH